MTARIRSITATLALVLAVGTGSATAAPRSPEQTPERRPVQVIRLAEHHGFDWGDAAIGAAGGLGLAMLVLGGGLAFSAAHRHGHGIVTTRRHP